MFATTNASQYKSCVISSGCSFPSSSSQFNKEREEKNRVLGQKTAETTSSGLVLWGRTWQVTMSSPTPGNTYYEGSLSTADTLIKVACFV